MSNGRLFIQSFQLAISWVDHLQYTVYNDSARRQQHGNGNFVFAAGAVILTISDQLKLIKWSTYKGSPFVAENFSFEGLGA